MRQWIRLNRGFVIFLLGFAFFRTAIADWNPVPTGSMRPTLLEGDVVLVNRLAYDFKLPLTDVVLAHLGEPRRGDVVTFSSPKDGTRLVKRLIAMPGDQVEMRDEQLFINGVAAQYSDAEPRNEPMNGGRSIPALRTTEKLGDSERRIQWLSGIAAANRFGPIVVPDGQYLMLGDNRDNSADSRYFGFVPRHLLIGQAHHILVSADIKDRWMPRFERVWLPL